MLTSIPFSILVGTILGILAGLGTGGGSLLILWLTLVCQTEASLARNINLLFFIPSAVAATLLRGKKNDIPWKKLLLPTAAGCVTAALFSQLSDQLNTPILQKIFGGLLICIGLKELFYKNKSGAKP
jgi:uncharacterized membrane protein YfcA